MRYIRARCVCVCVCCSHCLQLVLPQWLPGWHKPRSRGWRRSTAGWKIHQTAGDKTWPTLGLWEEGWGHWGHPWSETLLPWHWSGPEGNTEEEGCVSSGERPVCTDVKPTKTHICFISMILESRGLLGWIVCSILNETDVLLRHLVDNCTNSNGSC